MSDEHPVATLKGKKDVVFLEGGQQNAYIDGLTTIVSSMSTDFPKFVDVSPFFPLLSYGEQGGFYRQISVDTKSGFPDYSEISKIMSWVVVPQFTEFHDKKKREEGKRHFESLRLLGFKWMRIIYSMWIKNAVYDESYHLYNLNRFKTLRKEENVNTDFNFPLFTDPFFRFFDLISESTTLFDA